MWRCCAVLLLVWMVQGEYPDEQECPEDCDCHYFRVNYVTDCSESNFTEIPYSEISLNVYILDLNGNDITEVQPFPDDIKLRRLQLAENKLSSVTAEMFAGLKYMVDIDLSGNNITQIDPDAFRDSPGLITIELQSNPLQRINSGPLLICKSLLYLDISNCRLSHLNDEFFDEVPFLTTLYLSGNPLTDISLRLLSSLVTLEELKLSRCNLTYLHPNFLHDLIHLKVLDLSQNNFRNVEWMSIFGALPRLENLNLERSGLTGLPDDVFGNNTWIRNVDLSDNDFSETDIGTTLGENLKNLHHLDLGNCSLNSLDANSFSSAAKLKTLNLCHNTLLPKELLTALIPLKKLTSLSLRNCSLTRLPKIIFENITELRELDISWNPLNNVFEELLQPLQNLEYLDMGYSNLRKLSKNTFSKTTNLRKLILSGNALGDLEAGLLKELSKLVTLEINNCGLNHSLDQDVFFNETYDLQELRMAGNPLKIQDGPLIPIQLSSLKILDISNCGITKLPENAFSSVRNLTRLNLSNNQLTEEATLNNFLKELKHLEFLDLSSNRIWGLSTDFISGTNMQDINLTNNTFICNCRLATWWNWARSKGDLNHLIGATLTQEDLTKGGNKRKRGLVCKVDPKTPFAPTNSTRKRGKAAEVRNATATRTWARYLKESPCEILNLTVLTTPAPVFFPEPILPSPGTPEFQGRMVEGRPSSVSFAVLGGVSALVLAIAVLLIIFIRRRYSRNSGVADLEMPTNRF